MNTKEIRLIRLLVWVLCYLILLFIGIFLLIVPTVKGYKSTHKQFNRAKARYLQVRDQHDEIYEQLKRLQKKHRKIIEAYENRWSERRFIEASAIYFESIDLRPYDQNGTDPHYRVYQLRVRAKMQSPQNFYRFLHRLPQTPYVILTDFPVVFMSINQGEWLEGRFKIRVYEELLESKEANRSKPSASKPISKR